MAANQVTHTILLVPLSTHLQQKMITVGQKMILFLHPSPLSEGVYYRDIESHD